MSDTTGRIVYVPSNQITEQIEKNFTYHPPVADRFQVEKYAEVRDKFKTLAYEIVNSTPPSREQALALTNLEQAMFWANAAIARNEK